MYIWMLGDPIQAWKTTKLCKDRWFLSLRHFIEGIQGKTPVGSQDFKPAHKVLACNYIKGPACCDK